MDNNVILAFREWSAGLLFSRLAVFPILRLHRMRFAGFEKQHMCFAPVKNLRELPSLNQETDAFVCGSDVIWNPDVNFNFRAFYLDFAQKYKFSYAASFGKAEITDAMLSEIRPYLNAFNALSLREKTGAVIAKRCTDKPVRIVSDPVLLLTREDWNGVIPPADSDEKYVFVYITHESEPIRRYLDKLKKKTGLKIVYSAYGPKQALMQGMIQIQSPQRWLQLLRDAEYVLTNSFHATAFSVLFHKKFFTVVNGDKAKGINVRMNDFLSGLGLEDRIFSAPPEQIDLSEVDYSDVDRKIAELREASLGFLQENLETAYRLKQENEGNNK